MPHTLVLIRHGESEWNKLNIFTGWTDVDVTESGRLQAVRAGAILRAHGFTFDIAYTSVLQRAVRTLWVVLDELGLLHVQDIKSWRLNERHYGALQGLNKAQTAAVYGDAKVHEWRRSYETRPPPLAHDDPRHPRFDTRYQAGAVDEVPYTPDTESLADCVARTLPFWHEVIVPAITAGKRVVVAAHGNSLRGIVKYLDGISDADISELEIPVGTPLVYVLDDTTLAPIRHYYLGEPQIISPPGEVSGSGAGKLAQPSTFGLLCPRVGPGLAGWLRGLVHAGLARPRGILQLADMAPAGAGTAAGGAVGEAGGASGTAVGCGTSAAAVAAHSPRSDVSEASFPVAAPTGYTTTLPPNTITSTTTAAMPMPPSMTLTGGAAPMQVEAPNAPPGGSSSRGLHGAVVGCALEGTVLMTTLEDVLQHSRRPLTNCGFRFVVVEVGAGTGAARLAPSLAQRLDPAQHTLLVVSEAVESEVDAQDVDAQVQQLVQVGAGSGVRAVAVRLPSSAPPPSLPSASIRAVVPEPLSTAVSGAGLVAGEGSGAPAAPTGPIPITPLAFVSPTIQGPWAPSAPTPCQVKGYGTAVADDTRRVQLMLMYTGRMAEVL